jgi:hypothetical protein
VNAKLLHRAEQVAAQAGCTSIVTPAASAPGGLHLPSENTPYTYDQHPPTSGYHAPAPLPADPHVYSSPVQETAAVHNLEHGYVWIYYQPSGNDALPADVVSSLGQYASSQVKVKMAPYPQLDAGRSLALAAWNRLQQCPAKVTSDQASVLVRSFVDQFRGDGDAPEPNLPP